MIGGFGKQTMQKLDMKDIAIIDAFPVYAYDKVILNVGCGPARIDFHLAAMGYRVYATDIKRYDTWREVKNLTFHQSNIFDLASFPVKKAAVIIASQMLEHLKMYKLALENLIKLTTIRLIITIPWRRSFNHPGHCNFWDDKTTSGFKDVNEFIEFCRPYKATISKILTKQKDIGKQYAYLIVMDKRQKIFDKS